MEVESVESEFKRERKEKEEREKNPARDESDWLRPK